MRSRKFLTRLLCPAALFSACLLMGCSGSVLDTSQQPVLSFVREEPVEEETPGPSETLALSPDVPEVPENTAEVPPSETTAVYSPGDYVEPQYNDLHVIPDKHNTGLSDPESCNITLKSREIYSEYQGIHFRQDQEGAMYLDLGHPNHRNLEGELLFENVDFRSTHPLWTGIGNCHKYQGSGLVVKYRNCQFSTWYVRDFDTENTPVRFEFEDCSFESVDGCNLIMKRCYVGGGDRDGLNPGKNFYCHDTYISDICHKTPQQGATHLDGMQSLFCQDLYFHNCRWEVPDINYSVNAGGFSYAVYLEPIRGYTGKNVILDHCYINGGGYYSISCTAEAAPEDNIRIIEPFIGASYRKSPYYPSFNERGNVVGSITENPRFHDSLYVSSVWKDSDGKLHFLATNDTYRERTLTVYTDQGIQEFTLKKTYKFYDCPIDTLNFSDFPIDVEFTLEAQDPQYAIFYDGDRQIRFVNFTDTPVLKPQRKQ